MRPNPRVLFLFFVAAVSVASAQSIDCEFGKSALQRPNYPEAVARLTKCLNSKLSDRQRVSILQLRAKAYHGLKNQQLAVRDQEKAVELDQSRSAWSSIRLSIYLRERRHFGKALAAISRAENRDENGAGSGPGAIVYYQKGRILHESGHTLDAIISYSRAINRKPHDPWILYRRALAYESLENRVQAKRDLTLVAEYTPKEGYDPAIVRKLHEYGFSAAQRKNACGDQDSDCEFH